MRVRRLSGWQSPQGWTQVGDVVEMDDWLAEIHIRTGSAEPCDEPVTIAGPGDAPFPSDTDAHLALTTSTRPAADEPIGDAPTEVARASTDDGAADELADLVDEIQSLRKKADAIALGELHGVDIAHDLGLAEMKAQLLHALAPNAPASPADAS